MTIEPFDPDNDPCDARLAQLAESNAIIRANLREYLDAFDGKTPRNVLYVRIINAFVSEMPTWPPPR